MNNAALSLLSICRKALKLKLGFDSVEKTLPDAKLVVFTSDISEKTKERMMFFINTHQTPFVDAPFSSDDVHFIVGKRAAVLAITDQGLADAFQKKL